MQRNACLLILRRYNIIEARDMITSAHRPRLTEEAGEVPVKRLS